MFKLTLIFFIIFPILYEISRSVSIHGFCHETQQYMICGPTCPRKCQPNIKEKCPHSCVSGCFCKEEFVLNKHLTCVTKTECDEEDGNLSVIGMLFKKLKRNILKREEKPLRNLSSRNVFPRMRGLRVTKSIIR
uniref:TIL domain-containing protein n=1 Tax=Glossina brevipalpis TaxID=37001 RepID=A0A1A9WZI8_9MUSC